MKKKNKTETHTETVQIPITPDLKEQIINYCKLSKTSQNKFIESLINDFFNNKVVSNDFIKLDKPFYFNINDLIKNNSVVCTLEKPTSQLNNYYVIDKIINNLDKYEPALKTFCTGGKFEHKGILINCFEINNEIKYNYLLFIYDSEKENLSINIIKPNELIYNGLDLNNNLDLLKELQQKETDIKEHIKRDKNETRILNSDEINDLFNIDPAPNYEITFNRKHESLIKLYENYHILRPYYMEHFLNTLIYLMGVNPEIKKYIETFNINVDNINNFKTNWKYDKRINLLFDVLTPKDNKYDVINLNTLLSMEINNFSLDKAMKNQLKEQ